MSLKNKYLLKKLLKWVNKKQNNFNIYNAALKRKTPGVILLHLYTKHLDDMIYSSWDIKRDRLKLENLGHFLPFYHPKNQKKSKFWKNEKNAGEIIILHMIPKITIIIWCTVPEIRSETDCFLILGHFLPFLPD